MITQPVVTQPTYTYTYTPYTSYTHTGGNNLAAMQETIRQLQQILNQLLLNQGTYTGYQTPQTGVSNVDITTEGVEDIDDDRATLVGKVDFNNEDEATVYFQYGRSRTNLNYETVRIVLDDNDDEEFTQRIVNLRDDTDYYFRAVGEDERGRIDYGTISSFNTDDRRGGSNRNNDDEPYADTNSADNVDDDRAELNGDVDMNNYDNGLVFFVYGEDEDLVEEIEDEYEEYAGIDEEGDDLQKERVDTSFDGNGEFWLEIVALDEDTDYYFSICVEWEDDDNDPVITCGSTRDFTTDY